MITLTPSWLPLTQAVFTDFSNPDDFLKILNSIPDPHQMEDEEQAVQVIRNLVEQAIKPLADADRRNRQKQFDSAARTWMINRLIGEKPRSALHYVNQYTRKHGIVSQYDGMITRTGNMLAPFKLTDLIIDLKALAARCRLKPLCQITERNIDEAVNQWRRDAMEATLTSFLKDTAFTGDAPDAWKRFVHSIIDPKSIATTMLLPR